MESPSTWNLLTASLAVQDLTQPHAVWSFLVVQGLVFDSGNQRERFVEIVRHERVLDVTGPSVAARIADALLQAGIATSAASLADPWGRLAADRLCQIASWGTDALGRQNLDAIRQWRDSHESQ